MSEGNLTFVFNRVPFAVFVLAVSRLCSARFISKSHKHRLIKTARHHYGISYEDYLKEYGSD